MKSGQTNSLFIYFTPIVLVIALGACVQIEETNNPISDNLVDWDATVSPDIKSSSVQLTRIQFDDIPVPSGFFLRNHRNETFSFSEGATRIGQFVYWGRAKQDEVVTFYRQTMTGGPYMWTGPNSEQIEEKPVLSFEKGNDRCRITVKSDRFTPPDGVLVTISINK